MPLCTFALIYKPNIRTFIFFLELNSRNLRPFFNSSCSASQQLISALTITYIYLLKVSSLFHALLISNYLKIFAVGFFNTD
ncbi:Ribonuclease Z [Bienertia sinuspersici]